MCGEGPSVSPSRRTDLYWSAMTARIRFGESATPARKVKKTSADEAMKLSRRKPPTRLSKKSAAALLSSLAVFGLCAFQFGDRNGLNNLPFSQVQTLVSDFPHAKRMAQQGNI